MSTATDARGRVSRLALWTLVGLTLALLLWTWLVARNGTLASFDTAIRPPRVGDAVLEVARALAVITMPIPVIVATTGIAWWAHVRRLRNLSMALVISGLLSWAASSLLRVLVRRPRPPRWYDPTFTESGWSYPSTHVALMTTFAIMLVTTATVIRRPRRELRIIRGLAIASVALVCLDRWLLGAHWTSDIVGGLLVGGMAAAAAAAASRVVQEPAWYHVPLPPTPDGDRPVCAVIYNPAKVGDEAVFQRRITHELAIRQWDDPLWLTTSIADPGYAMSREAIAARADLVIVAGGDGTVRVVTSELAHSDVPVAIVPAGTANLLARNLGIPLDEDEAFRVAFEGSPQPIDLVLVTVDGDRRNAEHFAVMGGLGIDGKVMADTRAELKKAVRSVAYFVAVAQNINTPPVPATITVDDRLVSDNPATLMLVGNVGEVQAGLRIFPHATPFDGEIDLIATGPSGFGQWFRWGLGVLRRQHDHQVTQVQGKHVRIRVAEPMPYQFDGDTLGVASTFDAEVVPAAVSVMVPRR